MDKYYLALVRGHLSQEMVDISVAIGEERKVVDVVVLHLDVRIYVSV